MTNEIVVQNTLNIGLIKFGLMIYVTAIDGVRVSENAAFGFGIPWTRVQNGPPIRIGRVDRTGDTPLVPEIDLTNFWNTGNSPVSRIQAAIEWRDDKPQLRTMSSVSGTWTRRSGSNRTRALPYHQYWELREGDEVTFGHPNKYKIVLRIRFRGSPQ